MADENNTALPERQGKPWTEEEDTLLYDSFVAGQPLEVIAAVHQRGEGGIRSRLRLLGLIDRYGEVIDPPPPFVRPERKRAVPVKEKALVAAGGLKLAFAATTPDGWQIEIKSNRLLDRGLRERLDLMLQGALDTDAAVPSQ